MSDTIPVLFDTDIGSDIDDAVALGYLLNQPRCELVGITTVSGEARERAALADAICRAAGRRDIPIRADRHLRPLFKKYGVQASFGGHDHNYQHWEIDGHTFVVTGGFNRERLYDIEQKDRARREMAAGKLKKAEKIPHYVLVDVKGKKATYTVKGVNGQVIDRFTIKSIRR